MKKIFTKGNVLVNEIKVNDIHFLYELGFEIIYKVISDVQKEPGVGSSNYYSWKAINVGTGAEEEFGIDDRYSGMYGPNIYDYRAYAVNNSLKEANDKVIAKLKEEGLITAEHLRFEKVMY